MLKIRLLISMSYRSNQNPYSIENMTNIDLAHMKSRHTYVTHYNSPKYHVILFTEDTNPNTK